MNLRHKKILVTGSEGFIGSHLIEKLVEMGSDTKAFILYNSFNNWGWIDTLSNDIKKNVEVILGDIRDIDSVYKATENVDAVFHLASLIGIPYSYYAPSSYINTNIIGTLNILRACKEHNISKLIHTSTSETYGTAKYVPIDENHPLCGQSPYSASKIGADMLVESYYRSFDLPVVIVKPFNTYGPRQSARAIIPTVISQILSKEKKIKLGSLEPTRDMNYVKDTVNGFIKIMESDATVGETINIGTGKEISIGDLVRKIINIMNEDIEIILDKERLRPINSEVNRLCADNSKLKKLTSWQQQYSLEDGLKETIEWIKNNIKYYKPNMYNI